MLSNRTNCWVMGIALIGLFSTSACTKFNSIEAKLNKSNRKSKASLLKVQPIVAKPKDIITISGKNFSVLDSHKIKIPLLDGLIAEVPMTVIDSTSGSFEMPEGAGLGLKTAEFQAGSKSPESFLIVADQLSNSLPIVIMDQEKICSTEQYIDRNGETKTGTKNCTGLSAEDNTKLIPGNIKSGVVISGVVGAYPSASFPLTDASSTADLDAATFNAKVKSATAFEFWDSTGARQTGVGDADITAANIATGISIFGETGTLSGGAAPDAWDLRAGVTVGGVTGRLKVNCRNRIRTAVYNYDGSLASISSTGTTAGTNLDWWDTIDDYNNNVAGLPNQTVSAWSSNTECGGIEASAGDINVWKDVTTTGDGVTASTCAATSAHCTMQDKISGLRWSKLQGTSTWPQAINDCDILSHNGATDWRLPTQKELMDAYNHGIRSAASANWMTEAQMAAWFWSASSLSDNTNRAWFVTLAYGNTTDEGKADPYQVLCVR